MNNTLEFDDEMMERLHGEARRRKTTVAALVDAGLKHVLDECGGTPLSCDGSRPSIPTRLSGGFLVDISNRDELYRVFDEDDPLFNQDALPHDDSVPPLPHLPKWRGKLLVDISNRDEIYRVFDQDNPLFNQDANTRQ